MLFGNKVEAIKSCFNTENFIQGWPYVIFVNGMVIHGTFAHGNDKQLFFNYFNENNEDKQFVVMVYDNAVIYQLQSCTEKDSETYNAYNSMRAMNDLDFSKLLDLKAEPEEPEKVEEPEEPEKAEEPVAEDEPDMKSFNIRDARDHYNEYPLFIRINGDLVINYEFMEKLLYDDKVLIRISFGIKGRSCAVHTFKSKDVRIHVGGTTLTGKILNEHRDVVTCVEIRADDWKQLDWAQVVIKNRKDGPANDNINK